MSLGWEQMVVSKEWAIGCFSGREEVEGPWMNYLLVATDP